MQPRQPSRRHLLTGFLAGLFGCLCTAKVKPAPAAYAAALSPSPSDANSRRAIADPPGQRMTLYVYDAAGAVLSVTSP